MNLFSFFGALEIGLIYSLVALGVFISFRLLRFPDLTVDGSFATGGAVCAVMIAGGHSPLASTIAATLVGAFTGLVTGWLNVKLKIMDLLASILVMIALYSVNLRIMGGPNVPLINTPTLFTQLQPAAMTDYIFRPLMLLGVVGGEIIASEHGLGQQLSLLSSQFNTSGVLGILLLLALTGAAINALMNALENKLLRWR